MYTDYFDDWDRLPHDLQRALEPIVEMLDRAADGLFDRRLNLSFEAAVIGISVPAVIDLTAAIRAIRDLIANHVTVAAHDAMAFDGVSPITVYDLPIYMPCLYLCQLAQYLIAENVRVWKPETLADLLACVCVMATCTPKETETARVVARCLCDLADLDRSLISVLERERVFGNVNNRSAVETALTMLRR